MFTFLNKTVCKWEGVTFSLTCLYHLISNIINNSNKYFCCALEFVWGLIRMEVETSLKSERPINFAPEE